MKRKYKYKYREKNKYRFIKGVNIFSSSVIGRKEFLYNDDHSDLII